MKHNSLVYALFVVLLVVQQAKAHLIYVAAPTPAPLCPQHVGPPCPRYYNNTMDDYSEGVCCVRVSGHALLELITPSMTDVFNQYLQHILTNMPPTAPDDPTFYYGTTGRAVLFLKLWANTEDITLKKTYLITAKGYIDNAIQNTTISYTALGFFQSFTGTYAVAAVIYSALGDSVTSTKYIQQVQNAMSHGLVNTDYSFDTGVPGLIHSAVYLNWFFNEEVITNNSIDALAQYLIKEGVYYGKKYGNGTYLLWQYQMGLGWQSYGQGHGMFGTLQHLLSTNYVLTNSTALSLVRSTIDMLVAMQLPSGQFPDPFSMDGIMDDPDDPYPLVQWCHGAPGALALWTRAYEVFGDTKYLVAAEGAADYTWQKGLLTKGLMTCHGIS